MEKLELINTIKRNPKKLILAGGLATLLATAAIKDNVHLGKVESFSRIFPPINNPKE